MSAAVSIEAAADRFRRDGVIVVPTAAAVGWSQTLDVACRALGGAGMRPWLYWELHNPWSRAAALVDSWSLLDICQSPVIGDLLAALIGDDIVLFDSQIVPNPLLPSARSADWTAERDYFPLDGDGGVTVRIPFGCEPRQRFEYRGTTVTRLDVGPGEIVIHAAAIHHRSVGTGSAAPPEYVVRYFPATRRYSRDPAHPRHVALTDRYPWVNYVTMALWQVRGEDRAGNDFATGFRARAGRWTAARPPPVD
ncbi:MAG: hypothetical protein AAFX58_03915 [Pseudomonadota bacterium]